MRLGAILTCHNRKAKTLACLAALYRCARPVDVALEVFLVDDGSTDGTGEAVAREFPEVTVLRGDGSLFWNGGMRVAFDAAAARSVDAMLWLNDDTLLSADALTVMLAASRTVSQRGGPGAIVVGAVSDPVTGELTYGGLTRKDRWKQTTFSLVPRSDVVVECETLNGNCVLVPAAVYRTIGNLESQFSHGLGDLDYGLRARAAGIRVWAAPGFVGVCARNSNAGTFADASLPLRVRWKKMLSFKGLPARPWAVFTRRHCGPLWFLFWVLPYARLVLSATRMVRSPGGTKALDVSREEKPS